MRSWELREPRGHPLPPPGLSVWVWPLSALNTPAALLAARPCVQSSSGSRCLVAKPLSRWPEGFDQCLWAASPRLLRVGPGLRSAPCPLPASPGAGPTGGLPAPGCLFLSTSWDSVFLAQAPPVHRAPCWAWAVGRGRPATPACAAGGQDAAHPQDTRFLVPAVPHTLLPLFHSDRSPRSSWPLRLPPLTDGQPSTGRPGPACVLSQTSFLQRLQVNFPTCIGGLRPRGAVTSLKQRPLWAPGSRESGSPVWVSGSGGTLWGDADPTGAREAARMEPELGAGRGRSVCCRVWGRQPLLLLFPRRLGLWLTDHMRKPQAHVPFAQILQPATFATETFAR
uniref:Uncharacterized protein n=1 Tax=Myotis myotis TaxID=51298 RepID=A0A7J7Z5U3_MYOMY|nr:hypothetical protein mMyoMyo1_010801 [Myotis myotis]